MALKQTYLGLKDKLPSESEAVLVMRGRGNDELAPSRELLEDFNHYKHEFSSQPGFPSAFHYAWKRGDYETRFRTQITASQAAMEKLEQIAVRARTQDVYFICYEGYDKPCHRKLLLEIAEQEFHAEVDFEPFMPNTVSSTSKSKKRQPSLSLF